MGHFFNSDPESTDDIPSMSFQTELKKPSMSFQTELKTPHVIPGRIEALACHSGQN
ncbi:hypothetical protein QUF72_10980 [Desulfobacterales bacterium HSG2]|nr:hypothetical protein [Desulfobacterales bacterium HSG2]